MMCSCWIRRVLFQGVFLFFFLLSPFLWGIDLFKPFIESAETSTLTLPDHRVLRWAHWKPQQEPKNISILIFQGRASFIEKHAEFAQDLVRRGYDVFTFDWVGQGLSTRLVSHPQKGHVDSYETFVKDAHVFIEKVVNTKTPSHPLILFGSSMGGAISLLYMGEHPQAIQGAILESPMLDIATDPFPKWFARLMIRVGSFLGFSESYAPGHGDFDPQKDIFEKSKGTSDQVRFLRQRQYTIEYPTHVTGGATFGWVNATFTALDKLNLTSFLKEIRTPVLFLDAGLDKAIDTKNNSRVCRNLPKCQWITYPKSKHHIVVERDEIRDQFWKDFDHFMKKFERSTHF